MAARLRLVTDADRSAVESVLTLDDFFAQESAMLFRRLWRVTRDRAEAEDIVQEAFIVVLGALGSRGSDGGSDRLPVPSCVQREHRLRLVRIEPNERGVGLNQVLTPI
jgi:hypothetical protein